MKFVKCDKCGKVKQIRLVNGGYYTVVDEDNCEPVDYNDISEEYIADANYDLCRDCYNKLVSIRKKAEEEFVEEINRRRNKDCVETNEEEHAKQCAREIKGI